MSEFYDISMLTDIQISPEGDFVLAGLYESIQQDLQHWSELNKTELLWAGEFAGEFRKDLSKPLTPSRKESMKRRAESFLLEHQLVESVDSIEIVIDEDNHLATIAAVVNGQEIIVNVSAA